MLKITRTLDSNNSIPWMEQSGTDHDYFGFSVTGRIAFLDCADFPWFARALLNKYHKLWRNPKAGIKALL
ncbi:MAG TPA: hypothetical protein ENJ87_11590 [Gammaproteobacteria bacterium]|nr:hypothetical protein [Gammaproteobacteria bacterium]